MVKLGRKRGVNARLDTYKKQQQQKKMADEEILVEVNRRGNKVEE